ncbi:MAG: monovalent cation/H(+) antiporter subunit G [Solirubrobacterales bacterium]|nr:monovalent cation/H(+) antiporter subunit G [Solirubrobacterales bacterium]
MNLRHVVATCLLVGGVTIELFAVLGIAVMREQFDRLHYVGLAGYGAFLIGVSILVRESFSLIGDKALLTGVLAVLLGPIVVHATARSLRIRQRGSWRAGIERAAGE